MRKSTILNFFILTSGFFATWGSGLQGALLFNPAKIFAVLMFLGILYWIFFERITISYSKFLVIFLVFTAVHTLITYGLFFSNEFQLGAVVRFDERVGEFVESQGVGIFILRFYGLVIFSMALASFLNSEKKLLLFAASYGLGFAAVILLGWRNILESGPIEVRMMGGYGDPNAFGFACVMTLFLGLYIYFATSRWNKLRCVGMFIILTGLGSLLLSASRGSVIALFVGIFPMVLFSRRRLKMAFILIFLLFSLFTLLRFLPAENAETFNTRFSADRIYDGRGAKRIDIWQEYLSYMGEYFFWGVGFLRSMTVMKQNFNVPHNIYLQVFVEFGIVGLVLIFLFLFDMGKKLFNLNFLHNTSTIPVLTGLFFVLLVEGFSLNILIARETWLIMAILFGFLNLNKQRDAIC